MINEEVEGVLKGELIALEEKPFGAMEEHEFREKTPQLVEIARRKYGPSYGVFDADLVERLLRVTAKRTLRHVTGSKKWGRIDPVAVQHYYGLTDVSRGASLSERARLMAACYVPVVNFNTARGEPFRRQHRGAMLATLLNTIEEKEPDLPPLPTGGVPRRELNQQIWENYGSVRKAGGGFILLWGSSGFGKSILAQQLAERLGRADLSVTIRVSSDPALMTLDLERALVIEQRFDPDLDPAVDVLSKFQRSAGSFRHLQLIILDNVQNYDQLRVLFPVAPNVPVLVTAQSAFRGERDQTVKIPDEFKVEVGPMTLRESIALVHDQLPEVSDRDAEELHRILSGHPLCVDQATRYVSQVGLQALPELLTDLQQDPHEALEAVSENLQIPNGLLRLYERSLAELADQRLPTKLLMVMTWQSLDTGISRQAARLLTAEQAGHALVDHRFDAALSVLQRLGFARVVSEDLLTMHDLTRAIVMNLTFDSDDSNRALASSWERSVESPQPWDKTSEWLRIRSEVATLDALIFRAHFSPDPSRLSLDSFTFLFWDFWVLSFTGVAAFGGWQRTTLIVNFYQDRLFVRSLGWVRRRGRIANQLMRAMRLAMEARQDLLTVDGPKLRISQELGQWLADRTTNIRSIPVEDLRDFLLDNSPRKPHN